MSDAYINAASNVKPRKKTHVNMFTILPAACQYITVSFPFKPNYKIKPNPITKNIHSFLCITQRLKFPMKGINPTLLSYSLKQNVLQTKICIALFVVVLNAACPFYYK